MSHTQGPGDGVDFEAQIRDIMADVREAKAEAKLLQRERDELKSKLEAALSENAAMAICMERVRRVLDDVHEKSWDSSAMQVVAMALAGALVDPRKQQK